MLNLLRDPRSTDPAIRQLRRRLDQFYAAPDAYPAFEATPNRDKLYKLFLPLIRRILTRRERVRVLELGAGRTGLPVYLQKEGLPVEFDAQDVTAWNADYLRPLCRQVLIRDVSQIQGEYDLIVSTYVFEHVASPRLFLDSVARLLAPFGWHVLICPRYDLPGYLCPSLRHHSWWKRQLYKLLLVGSRLRSMFDRSARFWINPDPSVFHTPWYRDADAIHVVSQFDATIWHCHHGFSIEYLPLPVTGIRDYFLQRFLTINLACQKRKEVPGD